MASLLELRKAYAELPPELRAGYLVGTSVPDRPVRPEALKSLLTREGLDPNVVPQKQPEVLAFRNACRSVETRRGRTEGKRQIVTVGEVLQNSAEAVYQITAEARDEANRVIEHRKGMRVVYDKARAGDPIVGDDPIRVEPIDDPQLYRSLSDLAHRIELTFQTQRGTVQGSKVREILRDAFAGMSGTRWAKTTSLWFIAPQHKPTLDAWSRVLTDLYTGDAVCDITELPNTAGLLATLERKVGEHVQEEATKLMAEIAKTLGEGKKVNAAQFERMSKLRREIGGHAKEMQAHYGDEIDTVTAALELVDEQILEMWGRVE